MVSPVNTQPLSSRMRTKRAMINNRPAPITPAAPKKPLIKRHPIIAGGVGLMILPFFLAAMIGIFRGVAGLVSGPGVINIVHSTSYDDCMTLARDDNFAPEVCEGLNPLSNTAKINCAYEQLHKMPTVDCSTTTSKATTSSSSSQVSNFNDGFSTAKQDDCQQGDTKACTWLQTTNH